MKHLFISMGKGKGSLEMMSWSWSSSQPAHSTCPSCCSSPSCSSPCPCAVLVPAIPCGLPSHLVWGAVGVPSSDPSECPWPCLCLLLMAITVASVANVSYLGIAQNRIAFCLVQLYYRNAIRRASTTSDQRLGGCSWGKARWLVAPPRIHSVLKYADSMALAFCTTHKYEWMSFVLLCLIQKMQEVSC